MSTIEGNETTTLILRKDSDAFCRGRGRGVMLTKKKSLMESGELNNKQRVEAEQKLKIII